MDGEEIGMVLARASELRDKVSRCLAERVAGRLHERKGGGDGEPLGEGEEEEEDVDGEEEEKQDSGGLVQIRDALGALEQQLATLQTLQQQQLYERESTLAQIDRSRMILLSKLKDYEGEELQVIHEAAAFAGETIERDDDLLLPPYQRHLSDSLVLDDLYSSNFVSKHNKPVGNGLLSNSSHRTKDQGDGSKQSTSETKGSGWGGIWFLFGAVAKTAFSVAGAVALLSLAGFETKLKRNGVQLNVSNLFLKSASEVIRPTVQCPPGKVLVIENGEARCVVKERVEVPFESEVTTPNLSYGFG